LGKRFERAERVDVHGLVSLIFASPFGRGRLLRPELVQMASWRGASITPHPLTRAYRGKFVLQFSPEAERESLFPPPYREPVHSAPVNSFSFLSPVLPHLTERIHLSPTQFDHPLSGSMAFISRRVEPLAALERQNGSFLRRYSRVQAPSFDPTMKSTSPLVHVRFSGTLTFFKSRTMLRSCTLSDRRASMTLSCLASQAEGSRRADLLVCVERCSNAPFEPLVESLALLRSKNT